jgi:hypothetical protein
MYNKQDYINCFKDLAKIGLSTRHSADLTLFFSQVDIVLNVLCDQFFFSLINEKQLLLLIDSIYVIPPNLVATYLEARFSFVSQLINTLEQQYAYLIDLALKNSPLVVVGPSAQHAVEQEVQHYEQFTLVFPQHPSALDIPQFVDLNPQQQQIQSPLVRLSFLSRTCPEEEPIGRHVVANDRKTVLPDEDESPCCGNNSVA